MPTCSTLFSNLDAVTVCINFTNRRIRMLLKWGISQDFIQLTSVLISCSLWHLVRLAPPPSLAGVLEYVCGIHCLPSFTCSLFSCGAQATALMVWSKHWRILTVQTPSGVQYVCVPDDCVLADSCCLLYTHSSALHVGDIGCWELCPTMRTLLQPSTVQLTQSTTHNTSVTCGDGSVSPCTSLWTCCSCL